MHAEVSPAEVSPAELSLAEVSLAAMRAAGVVFEVLAEPSPGLLPRLLQPLARRNVVPQGIAAYRAGERLVVQIGLDALPSGMVSLIEGNLRQIVGVQQLSRHAG